MNETQMRQAALAALEAIESARSGEIVDDSHGVLRMPTGEFADYTPRRIVVVRDLERQAYDQRIEDCSVESRSNIISELRVFWDQGAAYRRTYSYGLEEQEPQGVLWTKLRADKLGLSHEELFSPTALPWLRARLAEPAQIIREIPGQEGQISFELPAELDQVFHDPAQIEAHGAKAPLRVQLNLEDGRLESLKVLYPAVEGGQIGPFSETFFDDMGSPVEIKAPAPSECHPPRSTEVERLVDAAVVALAAVEEARSGRVRRQETHGSCLPIPEATNMGETSEFSFDQDAEAVSFSLEYSNGMQENYLSERRGFGGKDNWVIYQREFWPGHESDDHDATAAELWDVLTPELFDYTDLGTPVQDYSDLRATLEDPAQQVKATLAGASTVLETEVGVGVLGEGWKIVDAEKANDYEKLDPDTRVTVRLTLEGEELSRLQIDFPPVEDAQAFLSSVTTSFWRMGKPVSIERPRLEECRPAIAPITTTITECEPAEEDSDAETAELFRLELAIEINNREAPLLVQRKDLPQGGLSAGTPVVVRCYHIASGDAVARISLADGRVIYQAERI